MISFRFFLRVLTAPFTIIRTTIQYYTTGTVYSRTNKEFTHSLWKNLYLSTLYHLASDFSQYDVRQWIYQPATALFTKFASHSLVKQLQMRNFGKPINANTYWLVENEGASHALIFYHGGGFVLSMFQTQFMGIIAVYGAIPAEYRPKISIAVVDYSLSCNGHTYPTQIAESLTAYKDVVQTGYEKVSMIGESAGGNLELALHRIIAYPSEAEAYFDQFDQFKSFDWSAVKKLPQPTASILVSPWVQPYVKAELPAKHGVDTYGDLGTPKTTMGDWYLNGLPHELVNDYVCFTNTNYAEHWAKVTALNDPTKNLVITGEREILRDGIELWRDIVNTGADTPRINYELEKGGVHSGMVYVESWDFMACSDINQVDFSEKFALGLIGKFITQVIDS